MDLKLVPCDFCGKEVSKSSLLLHIGKSEDCKVFYGKKYDELKKEKNRKRMKLWREKNGKKRVRKAKRIVQRQSI